ncbi:hypothetical protein HF313_02420 [Massilia atriviolacea]|uniref:Uncharacterized protein n=1 Tax=Massilia atriviolacea TaxID=2495579 RepID=A0A430HP44_9BURK|nr:hypothetical protein [Massilia atriviolacea]RSZ59273.1 hypothetical protein EJB06_08810 [Massilia atriviolacea]
MSTPAPDQSPAALLHELLLRGLWSTVIDEAAPQALQRQGGAVARLLAAGVDPHDLVDVIREAQVDTIYNVAQLIDWPDEHLAPGALPELRLSASVAHGGAAPQPLPELHSCLMERDPSGRAGEPRSPELRRYALLEADVRRQIGALVGARKFPAAAVLWKRHAGGDLKAAMDAVRQLAGRAG